MPTLPTTSFDLAATRQSLGRTPATLRALVGQLPDAALDYHETPEAWSPVQVLCHLCDGEITDWIARTRIILSTPEQPFAPFDREAGFNRFRNWSAAALLDEFERLRTANLTALDSLQIGPEQLQATGRHPRLGTVTLAQLLATWITHDFAHLAQISRATTRYFGRDVGPWTAFFSLLNPSGKSE